MENKTLSADKKVFLQDNSVKRPVGAWSYDVHSLLSHFHSAGLPVPRVLGMDNEYEYLEYISGQQVHPYCWSDGGLRQVARLVRSLHDAAESYQPRKDARWQYWCLRKLGNPSLYCHGDIAPWNVITRDGLPIGLIDWEFAGPLDPMTEFARVCWLFVQLVDDDLAQIYNLPDAYGRAAQVRMMADTYGLDEMCRRELTGRILDVAICETAHEAIDAGVTFDTCGNLWGMAWRTRSVYWIWRNRHVLENALK